MARRAQAAAPTQKVWLRADGGCPTTRVLHACIVTYASDMTLLDTTLLPHGVGWAGRVVQMASLDHAMWFHRPFRADEWLLYDQDDAVRFGRRAAWPRGRSSPTTARWSSPSCRKA